MSRRDEIVKMGEAVLSPILGNHIYIGFRPFHPMGAAVDISHTDFEALAAAWAFGPLRFSKKLANMALARAGKSRWIRSIR